MQVCTSEIFQRTCFAFTAAPQLELLKSTAETVWKVLGITLIIEVALICQHQQDGGTTLPSNTMFYGMEHVPLVKESRILITVGDCSEWWWISWIPWNWISHLISSQGPAWIKDYTHQQNKQILWTKLESIIFPKVSKLKPRNCWKPDWGIWHISKVIISITLRTHR